MRTVAVDWIYMSGVLARNRTLSQFEFYRNAIAIRVEVNRLMAKDKVCPKAYRLLNGVPTVETARSIVYNINRADHFYPNTSANVIERKKYITLAIADGDQLLQDMQCLIAMDVTSNINVFERVTLMIDREIELLKGYRKSVKLTGAQTPEQRLSALEEEIERLRSV